MDKLDSTNREGLSHGTVSQ
ncbi:hypothetical protein DMN91_002118 [Ooceraea biroi]|uniref:Uncharacterized protein n=1 Tax=Ooceraea biroi TaxID=2015173 RepID=A0A3L8E0P7_OOCBI|nr:hypothetical protein DMN91_002118 [Ooceraea biroi]